LEQRAALELHGMRLQAAVLATSWLFTSSAPRDAAVAAAPENQRRRLRQH
jgi:hypothetical protein